MKSRILFSLLAVLLATATVLTVNSCKKDEDSNDTQNTAPKASFTITPSIGTTSTQFEFDASACSDDEDEPSALPLQLLSLTAQTATTTKTQQANYRYDGILMATEAGIPAGITTKPKTSTTKPAIAGATITILPIAIPTVDCMIGQLRWALVLPGGIYRVMMSDIVIGYLGGSGVAGGKMKEAGTAHWNSPNTGATNSSGFTALPGGYRSANGLVTSLGCYGDWWTSTEGSSSNAWSRYMGYGSDDVDRGIDNKDAGFSVRCLKD